MRTLAYMRVMLKSMAIYRYEYLIRYSLVVSLAVLGIRHGLMMEAYGEDFLSVT